jgi:hypothetical protein
MAGDDRPLHFREVVAEPDRVDQFAGPLVVFGIERVDVAHAAAHEQEDDRPCTGRKVRPNRGFVDLARFCPQGTHRQPKKTASRPVKQAPPRDSSAGINALARHASISHR